MEIKKIKKELFNLLCEYDIFMDIPNQIIASTTAEEFIGEVIKIFEEKK